MLRVGRHLYHSDSLLLQGGGDSYDVLSCRSFLAKEPLITGLFCGKWPIKIRHPMGLRHSVTWLWLNDISSFSMILSPEILTPIYFLIFHNDFSSFSITPSPNIQMTTEDNVRCDVCIAVCCGVLQCVAVWCSVVQCGAVWCSVLQCVAVCCSVLQYVAALQHLWISTAGWRLI